jgi:hypothetical protein
VTPVGSCALWSSSYITDVSATDISATLVAPCPDPDCSGCPGSDCSGSDHVKIGLIIALAVVAAQALGLWIYVCKRAKPSNQGLGYARITEEESKRHAYPATDGTINWNHEVRRLGITHSACAGISSSDSFAPLYSRSSITRRKWAASKDFNHEPDGVVCQSGRLIAGVPAGGGRRSNVRTKEGCSRFSS